MEEANCQLGQLCRGSRRRRGGAGRGWPGRPGWAPRGPRSPARARAAGPGRAMRPPNAASWVALEAAVHQSRLGFAEIRGFEEA